MICRSCGKQLEDGTKFCSYCGAQQQGNGKIRCHVCNAECDSDMIYCNSCGSKLRVNMDKGDEREKHNGCENGQNRQDHPGPQTDKTDPKAIGTQADKIHRRKPVSSGILLLSAVTVIAVSLLVLRPGSAGTDNRAKDTAAKTGAVPGTVDGPKTTDDTKTTGDSNANGELESTGAPKSTGLPKAQPSAWPIADFEDEIEVQPDWESDSFGYYALNDDGTYTIMACILDDIPCMEVPAGFRGRAITGVGPQAFFYLHNVEQIRFPSTIETLSGSVFDNCDHLRAVFLPSSIREVKEPLVKHTLPESPRLVYFCSSSEDEIKERGWCEDWQGVCDWTTCTGASFLDNPGYRGWVQIGGVWLYFEDGFTKFGWQMIMGQWYYFQDDASAATGWISSTGDGNTYYFDETDCFMVTGWREIGGDWYYFDMENGRMLKDTVTPDGYYVDGNGICQDSDTGFSDYVIPESNTRYLTDYDVKYLSQEDLRLAINEVYARHGRLFVDSGLQRYFDSKSWYNRNADYNDSMLTAVEKANVELMARYRK